MEQFSSQTNNEQIVKMRAGQYVIPVLYWNEGDRIFFRFGYNKSLMAEIKEMQGAKYHGYDDTNPRKLWSVSDSTRNWFQIQYLIHYKKDDPLNPYYGYDLPLLNIKPKRECCYNHQVHMFQHIMTRHYGILAAEMGCISGDSVININNGGASSIIKMQKLYDMWQRNWIYKGNIFVRSLCGEHIGLNRIVNVLYKGIKKVVRVVTRLGKTITITPDHEICTGFGDYKAVENLKINDIIFTNGKWKDKDGYIKVGGLKHKHPRWTSGGVYEHIIVMEQEIGRYIDVSEIVHHKNEIKDDNRLENLELLTGSNVHAKLHGSKNWSNFGTGTLEPFQDSVIDIQEIGYENVYDIVCEDPFRNFVANGVIVHNCGKSLSVIEAVERSNTDAIWVAPKTALYSVQLEYKKWKSNANIRFMTYESLKKLIENWPAGKKAPQFVIYDESSRVKNYNAQRSQAARHLADSVRKDWDKDGFVILMSGSPAPKSPLDWWNQCETACPGFLREGTPEKFKRRLAILEQKESFVGGGSFNQLVGWRDDPKKCNICGLPAEAETHTSPDAVNVFDQTALCHKFEPTTNEVELLYKRMQGLVLVKFKRDCLDLPEKIYREIILTPTQSMKNAAGAIKAKASSTIQALTLLRELSDGFQYRETASGSETCPNCHGEKSVTEYEGLTAEQMSTGNFNPDDFSKIKVACHYCSGVGEVTKFVREIKEVSSPKEEALKDILEENSDTGRLVVYGGFTGSIDKICKCVQSAGWQYIRVDGRGWFSLIPGDPQTLLEIFQDNKNGRYDKVVFIAQPDSAGMGITLTASSCIVYYSNSFNAEGRIQSEDRIHRIGMDVNRGATIIDLLCLPSDKYVLDNLKMKRRLQDITMGDMKIAIENISMERDF